MRKLELVSKKVRLCESRPSNHFIFQCHMYRVAQVVVENLLLTLFRHFWQLVGHNCGYLQPRSIPNLSQLEVVTN